MSQHDAGGAEAVHTVAPDEGLVLFGQVAFMLSLPTFMLAVIGWLLYVASKPDPYAHALPVFAASLLTFGFLGTLYTFSVIVREGRRVSGRGS